MKSLLGMVICLSLPAQTQTRGLGNYPGNPDEFFGPTSQIDATYRNLARNRAAYHSSSHDYNLTAQLVTDGIVDSRAPRQLTITTSDGNTLEKRARDRVLDGNWVSNIEFKGEKGWVQFDLGGGTPFTADRVEIDAVLTNRPPDNNGWEFEVQTSPDGQQWNAAGKSNGMARPTGELHASVTVNAAGLIRYYRVAFQTGRAATWRINDVLFYLKGKRVEMTGPFDFTSAWVPAGKGSEWVYVDLGAVCTVDRVALKWIRRAAEGAIEVSDDAKAWKQIGGLANDELKLSEPASARYVRVLLSRPATPEGYALSELEVWGKGGPVPVAHAAAEVEASGKLNLAGGAWKVQRSSAIKAGGAALSTVGFPDKDWIVATVPGTILTSYYNAGAVPDPNFSNNQLMISDSFFYSDFWYRTQFETPRRAAGRKTWLNFDGINWKAEVFLNGKKLGRIEGAFIRARYDVTGLLAPGGRNALAVRIEKNATPGAMKEKTLENPDNNGGTLGADNPTFHPSVGWDWIPTIRGRNTGIWNSVHLDTTGAVTIEDPFVTSKLSLPSAAVNVEATLANHGLAPVVGTLHGRFGDATFEETATIAPGSKQIVRHRLELPNPKLWWPAGYGAQDLYDVELRFEPKGGAASDVKSFKAGVREFTYSEEGNALKMWINGRRFVPRGGNWGFSESMLRYRAREYETALRYHRDMNFTMVRNWVGQIGEDAFYEACDRNGIVVMQDFWLANPWDGPDPDDNAMFMRNADDTIKRIRNHASIGLYCGRNEGYPPQPLEDGIRKSLAALHPGIFYIPSSADGSVSGHGPYAAQPVKYYFDQRATPQFHSELGMPNIMTLDSLKLMLKDEELWPFNNSWGIHDFCLEGAMGLSTFINRIQKSYGGADNVGDWVTLAQFVNYEGHRAMFEAQSRYRMGLLIWMSHPTWPTQVWQTYDYYFEPTAGYFGAKKASEPLHIQWNAKTDEIEVVNYSAGNATGLTATVELRNLDGSVKWEKTAMVDAPEDSVASPIRLEFPADLSPVHFVKLKLARGGTVVSENFYWRSTAGDDYTALRKLPKVQIEAATRSARDGARWILTTELRNGSEKPALMIRLKAVRGRSGDRILPALYADNYVSLMPGERRTITTEVLDADARGESPAMAVEGFNLENR